MDKLCGCSWEQTCRDCKNLVKPGEVNEPVVDPISADAYFVANRATADARAASGRIVRNLWTIFVLLPIVLAVLFAIVK
jgi:hypothetical protein